MTNLIKIILGASLFMIGIAMNPGLFSIIPAMVGCYILSRPFALDSGFGNTPALFLIGMIGFIPGFFLSGKYFGGIGMDDTTIGIIRITLCLVCGVMAFLSISKK